MRAPQQLLEEIQQLTAAAYESIAAAVGSATGSCQDHHSNLREPSSSCSSTTVAAGSIAEAYLSTTAAVGRTVITVAPILSLTENI